MLFSSQEPDDSPKQTEIRDEDHDATTVIEPAAGSVAQKKDCGGASELPQRYLRDASEVPRSRLRARPAPAAIGCWTAAG